MNKITDDIIAVAKTKAIADKIVKPIQSQLQKPTLAQTQSQNIQPMRFKKSVTKPVTPFALPKKPEVVNVQKPTATPMPISPALSGSPLVKAVTKKKDDKAVDVQEETKDFIKTDWGRIWDETVVASKNIANNLQGVVEGIKIQSIKDDQRIFGEAWKNPKYADYYNQVLKNKEGFEEKRTDLAEENRQVQSEFAEKYKGKEQSKFGTLAGQVSSGITQMIPMIVANAVVPGAGLPVMFAQVYESEYQSAKFDGASEEDAQVYGFFKGAIEAGTEYLFGGVPLMGEGLADTTGFKSWLAKGFGGLAEDSLMNLAQSELGKQFVSKAIDVLGEGAEEYISEVLGSVAVKAYKETDKGVLETLAESAGSKEAWDAWFIGSVTSAVMNLESYGIGKALQTTMKEKKLSTITPEQSFEIAKVIGEKLDTDVEWLETDDPNDSREGLYIPATEGQRAKIYLNPNSQKAVGTVAIHEIGHDLVAKTEGQDLVNEFLKTFYKSEELVDLYANTQAKYQSAYNDQFIMKHSGLTQAQVDALDQTQYRATMNQLQSKFKDLRQVEKNEILEEMFTKTLEKVIDSPAGMRRLVTGNLTVAQKIRRQFASLGASLAEDKKFFQLQEMEDLFNVYMEGYTDYVKMQKAQSKALQEEALAPKTELGRVLAKPVMASVQGKEKYSIMEDDLKRFIGRINGIDFKKSEDGVSYLTAYNKNGDSEYISSGMTKQQLDKKFGKEIADMIMDSKGNSLRRADLDKVQPKIDYANLPIEEVKKIVASASRNFGLTNDFREGGYLTVTGKLLDFSGKRDGGRRGQRAMDHREIYGIGYDMEEFIQMGNIRMKPEADGFELAKTPTKEQKSLLRQFIAKTNGEVYVDLMKPNGDTEGVEYNEGTSATKIFNDIETYFTTGKVPEQSDINKYRYSIAENGNKGRKLTQEQREYFKDTKVVSDNGDLLEVYHGSPTAGFMTFNGDLGEGNYKYSGKNVSFFTSNKAMAESYAISDKFVDTKKIESLSQVEKYLEQVKEDAPTPLNVVEDKNGNVRYVKDFSDWKHQIVENEDGSITVLGRKDSKIGTYKNKEDLFRNIKLDVAKKYTLDNAGMYSVYLNIKKPMIVDAKGSLWNEIQYQGKEITTNDLVKMALESNKYDGLIIKNVEDNGTYADEYELGDVYITFDSNQVKSTDNKKPTQDSDIRYSLSDKELDQTKIGEPLISEEEMDSMLDEIMKSQKDMGFDVKYSLKDAKEKNLVALHNLTEDKLMGLLDLGGIPVPSIAITRADIGHENFGDITIVMKPDVVDPKKTPVFSADAYSPRFPTMYEKADRKKLVEALKNFQTYDGSLYIEKYERTTHDKAVKELSKEMGAMINYLRAKGIEYKTETKPYESKGWGITSSLFDDFIEQNPELEKLNIYDLSVDEVMSKYKEKTLDLVKKALAKYNDVPSFDFGFSDVDGVLSEVKKYIEDGKKSEQENIESTIKNIESAINSNKEDFRNWISEKLEGVYGDKVIVKPDVERFYPDGSRKPESAITLPATLENLVKTLKNKGKIAGEEAQGGQGVLNALLSTQFSSVSELKGNKSRLSDVQSVNNKITKTNEKYYKLLNKLSATFTENYGDDISVVLNDYVKETGKSRISEESFKNYMNKWHYNVDSKLSNETMSFFEEIKKLPTKYFEAKPQRAVNFNEIETALIPETANDKLIQKLDEKGISYIKYNDVNDRKSIISTLDNAKFSLKDDIKFRQSEDFVPEKSLAKSDLLTEEEQVELEGFIAYDDKLGIPESDIQFERYNELVLKAQGKVVEKFKGLKVPKSKEDVYNDPNFKAYKDAKFDPKVMNNALELVKGYRGTEKRTKDQWLMIANQIGANIKTNDPEALKKYAVQTWYANSPNQKDRLNRQGTKFNPFFIHEWVAEVYKGARVGTVTQVKQTQETEVNIPSDVKAVLAERGEPITQMIEQLQSELPIEETVEEPSETVDVVREEPTEEVAKLIEDIEETERVRKHEQTIASTDLVSDKTKSRIEKEIQEGQFTYQVFSDKKAVRVADFNVQNDKNHELYNRFIAKVENNEKITKQDIADAEMMIVKYSKEKGQWQKVDNLIKTIAVAGTELGQAVQAMSLIRKMSGVGQYMVLEKIANKLNKQYEEEFKDQIRRTKKVKGKQVVITIDPELRQKLIETPSDDLKGLQEASEAIKQNIADQMPSTTMDKVTAWRYLSMLGNPRTHVRNILGNALFVPLRIAKDGIAMVLERQLPVAERTKAIVPRALNKGIFEFAENDYAENINTLQTGGKYNVSSDIERRKTIFKTKWLETARVKNFDFLEKEDAFFKHSSYVNAMAQFMKARNLTAETITDAQVAEARNHAYQVALKMTYQDASNLASTLTNLENKGGKFTKFAMSAVLPFKKTPINILKRGVEFSPVGLTLGLTTQMLEYKKGNITQAELIDSISAGMTGTGIALVGALMASMGLLNIDEDEDKKKSAFDKSMGFQKYSINVLGQSFTIDWAVPAVMPLFVGASVFKQMDQEGLNLFDANVLKDAMTNVFNPAFEMSMLEGLTNTLMSYSSSGAEKVGDMITTMGTSYAGQFVPTVSGQIARIIDQSQRSTYAPSDSPITPVLETFLRRMANKIPLASMLNPKVINLRGEEVKQSDNLLIRAFNNLINPAYVASSKVNDTDKELIKLFDLTKDNDAIPKTASKSFVANGETYKLDSEAYSTFAKTMGTTSYDLLQKLTQSKAYEAMSNDERVTAVSRIYEYAQTKAKAEYLLSKGKRPSGKTFATYEKLKNAEAHGVSVADYVIAKQIHDGLGDMTISKKSALIVKLVNKGYNYEKVVFLVNNIDNYTLTESDKSLLKERIRAYILNENSKKSSK